LGLLARLRGRRRFIVSARSHAVLYCHYALLKLRQGDFARLKIGGYLLHFLDIRRALRLNLRRYSQRQDHDCRPKAKPFRRHHKILFHFCLLLVF
jgi:hypothetical protein